MHHLAKLTRLFIFLLLAAGLAACSANAGDRTPTPSPMRQEFNDAIGRWEALGITSYAMNLTYRHPGWEPQTMVVEVRDGTASFTEKGCFPERDCYVRPLEAADFTLAHILPQVATLIDQRSVTHIVYHDQYFFPRIIDSPEEGWEISNFRLLDR